MELARAGHNVIATMRNKAKGQALREIAEAEKLPLSIATLDVDSDDSVRECFSSLGVPLDVLINNAGIGSQGTVEETPLSEFQAMMNTNYFGIVRCVKAALPGMRTRGQGLIINISSVSGKIAGSAMGAYSASKFAVEALSEALAGEVKSFGIRVAIVEPGTQDTPLAHGIEQEPVSLYPQPARFAAMFRAALKNPIPPEATAQVVRHIIENPSEQLRYPAGPDAEPFLGWRASMSDAQWIHWNAQDDDGFYAAIERDFGLKAR